MGWWAPRPATPCRSPPPPDPYSGAVVTRRLALLAAVLFVLAACVQSSTNQSHDLTLGAIYPLSGPQAPAGKQELAGVRAALAVAESSGNLKTHIRLHVIDATTPEEASAAGDKLVHALLGLRRHGSRGQRRL